MGYQLRDLDRPARRLALLFVVSLLLPPVLAFAWAVPDWAPEADPALMGLRALDVGTSRTPLTGQPSTSGLYSDVDRHVDHPGPVHFYVMAPAVRLLGAQLGMLVVSLLIVGSCVLISAWAVFRQLGPPGGIVAAVALGTIMFTTGASSLVDPVSSSIAGYPLLCSMVLLWCLVCGDVRLLPLTTVVVSFTAQQHLSVLPGLLVATAAGVVGCVLAWRRKGALAGGPEDRLEDASDDAPDAGRWRRQLVVMGRWSAALAALLWSPVVLDEIARRPGNLTRMVRFAGGDERPTLGFGSAVRQLAHVLGLPPLLGQRELAGTWLLARVSPTTWLTAATVVVLLAYLGWRWRRSQPRQAALVVMAGVIAVGGLLNGSSVPVGIEQTRLSFYHWAFALALFVGLSLGLALVGGAQRSAVARRPWLPRAAAGAALLAIVVPSVVNPALDRPTNTLVAAHSPVERRTLDRVAGEVMAGLAGDGEPAPRPTVLLALNDLGFLPVRDGLALALTERGLPVTNPLSLRWFVDDERLVDWSTVQAGLVLVVDEGLLDDETADSPVPGELIADVDTADGFDRTAYEALVSEAEAAGTVRLGASAEQALDALDNEDERGLFAALLTRIPDDARELMGSREVLTFLRDHPLEQPQLDPQLIGRVLDTLPADTALRRLRVFRLDRDQLLGLDL